MVRRTCTSSVHNICPIVLLALLKQVTHRTPTVVVRLVLPENINTKRVIKKQRVIFVQQGLLLLPQQQRVLHALDQRTKIKMTLRLSSVLRGCRTVLPARTPQLHPQHPSIVCALIVLPESTKLRVLILG